MITAPAISMAGPSSWGIVTGWDNTNQLANVLDHLWSQVQLKQTINTVHLQIDWSQLPPGPCKTIAMQWDALADVEALLNTHDHHHGNGHHHQRQLLQDAFAFELNAMADNQCKITFVGGTTNGDGSVNLNQVAPSP
jgi:hypothetical protein